METEATMRSSEEATDPSVVSPEAPIYDQAGETEAPVAAAEATAPSAELDRLAAELTASKALADDNQRKYLLALADFDNFRKLTEKRIVDRLAFSKKSTIGKFLPVLDNLTRALSYEPGSEGLKGGLQATLRGFESVLAGENVTAITVVGAPFDPRTAEAITTRDSADHDDDVVLEEVERGYQLGDELLRPAKVIVARHVDAAS